MEVKIPQQLTAFTHGAILRQLQELNKDLKVPSRTAWGGWVPDLVHRDKRIAVELELTSLTTAWGQCLNYYRSGAVEIHLIVTPKLYAQYESHEETYIKKNPIPNVRVYVLPEVPKKKLGRPPESERIKKPKAKRKISTAKEKKKFFPPRPHSDIKQYIKLKNGTTIRPRLTETDKRVGLDNVYFPLGEEKKGGKCIICGGRMMGRMHENLYGRKTVLYECSKCGHLHAETEGEL